MFVETLILFVIFLILSEVLKPKPHFEDARPAGLGDFNFPTATEGRPVPVFWGTVKLSGPNVIWYGDLRQSPITKKIKTGLFSSTKQTLGYRYFIGIQMALCRGGSTPVGNLLRIWIGDDEVFNGDVGSGGEGEVDLDLPELFGGDELGTGGVRGTVRFFNGSYTQNVSDYLSQFQQISTHTPAYRGTCYVNFEAGYIGNSTTIKPWAFECRRIPNGLGLAVPTVNSGNDANIVNVIFELLTNIEWGLGQPSADINIANFTAAADTLRAEGNGFSFLMDTAMKGEDLLKELERQMDGVVYINRSTGKYEINLARGGYVLADQFALNDSNVSEVQNFTRGSWADTTNNILLQFFSRTRDYQETYAGAQDMANMRLQGNIVVTANQTYPGVKDASLGNNIAWRNLRTLAYPLARATVVVDRTIYNKYVGNVVRWTNAKLGLVDFPMRITKMDLGQLVEGKITVDLVQDVFTFDAGVFTAPTPTNWVVPPQTIGAIPTADSLVFEAPRAFITRDPVSIGVLDRIWAGARYQGDASVDFSMATRPHGSGTYTSAGTVSGFLVAATLHADMTASGTQGSITITLEPTLEDLSELNDLLNTPISAEDVGQQLSNLIYVGGEFMGFKSYSTSAGNLVLAGGYRGLLDSVPSSHTAGDRVWILFGNITSRNFPLNSSNDVKLLPRSRTQTLLEGSATAIVVDLNDRGRKPYPPVNLTINSSAYPSSSNIDNSGTGGPGSGLDDRGLAFGFTRRDYRTADETAAVLNEGSLPADFPAANTTQYSVSVYNDPAGSNTLLFSTSYIAGVSPIEVSRSLILRNTAGVIPSTLRVLVHTRHTDDGVVYFADQDLAWDFAVTASVITGSFNWGNLANGVSSSSYVAANTGTFTLSIGTALSTGNVEVNVNGAGFVAVITAGNTSGTFSAVSGNSIVIRHTQTGSTSSQTFCGLTFGGASKAYAILTY